MIQPPFLRAGDTIGIIAPGRKIDREIVIQAQQLISSYGYKVLLGENLFSNKHSYLAGLDDERLHDLQFMLDNPAVNAILCARGGYGVTRIADQVDFSKFLKTPKWICGFSDITALHVCIQKLGVQSIHSTMPVLFAQADSVSSVKSLMDLLTGIQPLVFAPGHEANKNGKATGLLTGGNLSLLADSLGTPSEINTDQKILVLEEVDEFAYRIDRMMVQLKRAGKFRSLAGLVVGHFTGIKETELPFAETVETIILNHVREYTFPVGFNFPIGHQNPNLAWIEGATYTLTASSNSSILEISKR